MASNFHSLASKLPSEVRTCSSYNHVSEANYRLFQVPIPTQLNPQKRNTHLGGSVGEGDQARATSQND